MEHIRVALCGLTRFDSDIVRTLVEDASFVELVTSVEPTHDLGADFLRSEADLMVSSVTDQEMDRRWRAALSRRRPLAVLNILDDCARARVHALYPYWHTVVELNEQTLSEALRHHLHALSRSAQR